MSHFTDIAAKKGPLPSIDLNKESMMFHLTNIKRKKGPLPSTEL